MTCLGSASPFQRIMNRSASVWPLSTSRLRDDRLVEAAGGLGGVRQHHHRDPAQVLAGLLVGDVVGLPDAERRREHRDRGLDVDADVAGVHRDVVGLGGRQAGLVGAVDQQAPDVLERHPADDLLDVDAAVAQRRALLVGLGDLGLEGDDALEPVVTSSSPVMSSSVVRASVAPQTPRHHAPLVTRRVTCVRREGPLARLARMASRTTSPPRTSAALRREYGDRGPRPRPTSRPTRSRCSAAGSTTRSAAGLHEPNAMVVATVSRRGPAVVADGAAQGRSTSRLRVLHQLRVPQGRGAGGQPALLAAVPVAPPPAPGPGRGRRVEGVGRGERGLLRQPARGSPSSAPGRRRSRGWWRRGPRSTRGTAACWPGSPSSTRCPSRRTGAGTASRRGRGVLAGPPGPDARPAGLPPRRGRPARAVDGGPARAVTAGHLY